ncbi:MAG: RsmD family RNA methyltransferase, partial [Pseudomonadota bacterium]
MRGHPRRRRGSPRALGLEALSRGATHAVFVDDHAPSRALIRTSVDALGLAGCTKIWRRD